MSIAYPRRSQYKVTVPARGLIAAALVLIAMWAFYWSSNGLAGMGDWATYRVFYDTGGGYLARQGRDPAFVWLMSVAASTFGYEGYDAFRNVLFAVFSFIAARWAYLARGFTPITALSIFATLIVKCTVQIREGVAFFLLAWPLIGLYVHRPKGKPGHGRSIVGSLLGGVVAAFTHFGTSIFLGVWMGAGALTLVPRKFLAWRYMPRTLLIFGVAAGLSLGASIVIYPQPFERLVLELTGGASTIPQVFLFKILYWLTMGLLTIALGSQMVKAAVDCGPFGYAYAITLGRFALPMVCSTCVFLVVSSFTLVNVTEWGNRILVSLLELAIILITLRGRANYLTLLMSMLLLANEARAFVPYWGLDPPV